MLKEKVENAIKKKEILYNITYRPNGIAVEYEHNRIKIGIRASL